jgi:hypothetical protein
MVSEQSLVLDFFGRKRNPSSSFPVEIQKANPQKKTQRKGQRYSPASPAKCAAIMAALFLSI